MAALSTRTIDSSASGWTSIRSSTCVASADNASSSTVSPDSLSTSMLIVRSPSSPAPRATSYLGDPLRALGRVHSCTPFAHAHTSSPSFARAAVVLDLPRPTQQNKTEEHNHDLAHLLVADHVLTG